MSEKIVQLNEEVIKGQLKELVRGSVRVSNIGYTQSAARKSREGWRFAKQIRPDLD